jgi:hypothetical protein
LGDEIWFRWMLDHVWGVFVAIGALLFRSHRQEIREMKASISQQADDLEAHRLHVSENYVRHPQLHEILASQKRTEERVDDIYRILTKGKVH